MVRSFRAISIGEVRIHALFNLLFGMVDLRSCRNNCSIYGKEEILVFFRDYNSF